MPTTVALLGTGLMGAGMARSMLRAGLDVTVWNRTRDKAQPLAADGATVADSAEAAVADADVVVTMLFDADSVAAAMDRALPAMRRDAVWVQSSTVGLDGTAQLAELAERHRTAFLDAPVLGTRQPAEQGALVVLVGGPQRQRDTVAPVFDAVGSRTVWVGEHPGDGHRLKLVANSWVLSVTAATAQGVGLARNLGLDPQQFLEVISGGPLDCGYAQTKGKAMITHDFATSFSLDGAVKDSALIADAMTTSDTDDRIMRALHDVFATAADRGHENDDMAAVAVAFCSPRPEIGASHS